jgi:hypothetical protein
MMAAFGHQELTLPAALDLKRQGGFATLYFLVCDLVPFLFDIRWDLIIAVAAAGGKRLMAAGCATGIFVGVRGDISMSPLNTIILGY